MKLPKSKYEQTKLWDLPLVKEMKCVQDLFSIVSIDESGVFELVGKHYSKLYVLKQRYVQRAETVQNLLQSGYTKTQIRCLYELIMADYNAKRIKEMFPTNAALEEIKNFAKIL